jgi:hypothetical protein
MARKASIPYGELIANIEKERDKWIADIGLHTAGIVPDILQRYLYQTMVAELGFSPNFGDYDYHLNKYIPGHDREISPMWTVISRTVIDIAGQVLDQLRTKAFIITPKDEDKLMAAIHAAYMEQLEESAIQLARQAAQEDATKLLSKTLDVQVESEDIDPYCKDW